MRPPRLGLGRPVSSAVVVVALALVGTLVAVGLIEAGFRIYNLLHPPTAKGFFWVRTPDYGWGLAPGRERLSYDDHGEFRTVVRINSRGLHDVEHKITKGEGIFRVLVLGDSYIEALQVDLEQSFGRVLEQRLNTQTNRSVEVVSAGVSSWGTDNELLYFRHEGYKYHPDLVLLAFTASNDVRENYAPFNRMDPWANMTKPTFVLSPTGSLEMQAGAPVPPPPPWWRQLYVGAYLYERLGGRVVLPQRGQNNTPPPRDPNAPHVPPDLLVHAPEYPDVVKEAWRVTEALIRALRGEAAAHGANFAVMVHSGPWAHYDDRWRLMLALEPGAAETWDRRKPARLIDAFLSSEGIPSVDLFDALEAGKVRERMFFGVNVHWTPAGHRVAAETVSDFLVTRGLIPRREPSA
jgi:hypothetical protein